MSRPVRAKNSPYWQYDFQRQGRRFHGSTGTRNKAAAQKFIDNLLAKIASGEVNARSLSLDEALGTYFERHCAHQPSAGTTQSQMRALLRHLKPGRAVEDLTSADLADYATRRRSEVSDSTTNRELQCLRRALRWSAKALGTKAPDFDFKGLLLREPKGRVRALTRDEEDRLFAALREDLHPIALFCLGTGVRLGGARGLTWGRVDLPAGRCVVRIKGGSHEAVPLTPTMVALIANQPRLEGIEHVFTWRPRGGARRPISPDGWRKAWAAALRAAKIEDFRWHDFRHAFATRWRQSGGDLFALQQAMHHRDIGSTRRYAHVDEDDVREGLARMEARSRHK